ncbi:MAG: TonB-dependent receptor [Saprospiraceae bacterium]
MLIVQAALTLTIKGQNIISISVSGACNMCKERIEKSAMNVEGVESSFYSVENQTLTVNIDASTFEKRALVKAILQAGHDAEGKKASDKAYNALHSCCKYRDKSIDENSNSSDHFLMEGDDHSDHMHDESDDVETGQFSTHKDNVISGKVMESFADGKQQALIGASLFWQSHPNIGTITDESGQFEIPFKRKYKGLIISYIGYRNDTLDITKSGNIKVIMHNETVLDEVTIAHKRRSTEFSFINPIKIQQISSKELMKAACCSLAESFDTTPSIDGSMTDAVTGTRRIEMLGLAGPYIQITRENMPDARGLSAIQSLHSTPGPWVEGMQLNMGAGSVINGFESITGQINVELKKSNNAEKMHFNAYGNQAGRLEFNHFGRAEVGDHLGTATFLHLSTRNQNRDLNADGFMDMPKGNQVSFLNRWDFSNVSSGHEAQAGVKLSFSDQVGGQNGFDPLTSNRNFVWGANNQVKRAELWLKKGYVNIEKPYRSLGLQFSGIFHDIKSQYGVRKYNGIQRSLYFNAIYQTIISNNNHGIRTGFSTQMDNFDETAIGRNFLRTEIVPGVFSDYTYKYQEKITMVLGLRGDYHNNFGFFLTPRINLRFAPKESLVFRMGAGRGQRTQSIFAENVGIFASNRDIIIQRKNTETPYGLNPEVAWNFGASVYKEWSINEKLFSISLDYNRVNFENKIVMDLDQNQNEVHFYNLAGKAYSNSSQILIEGNPLKSLDIKLAYRYNDVKTTFNDELMQQPLISPHKAFMNFAIDFGKGWLFDYTINWLSSVRIPLKVHDDHPYLTQSPDYFLSNLQWTKSFSNSLEWYFGGENIFDYRVHDAIIAAHDPRNADFDASLVWGPMMGRNVYLGVRYTIK